MTKSKPDETSAEQPTNFRLWDQLSKTDPKHTKAITGRGFDGTAIKPMYSIMKMTELFGPVGTGWGMDRPDFTTIPTVDGMLVFCTASVWYIDPDGDKPVSTDAFGEPMARVYGVGGDVVHGKRASGKLFADDEAFKKAYTDALGNAFKFLGVAADIHMGQFDDSKYVQQLNEEFRRAEDPLIGELDALLQQIKDCTDVKVLVKELAPVAQALAEKLNEAKPARPGDVAMLTSVFNARKARLTADLHGTKPGGEKLEDMPDIAATAERDQVNADTGN
jgi:hypothetical protein